VSVGHLDVFRRKNDDLELHRTFHAFSCYTLYSAFLREGTPATGEFLNYILMIFCYIGTITNIQINHTVKK